MFTAVTNHRGTLAVIAVLGIGWGVAVQSSHVGQSPDHEERQQQSAASDAEAYANNLSLIQASSVRNTNHDQSAFRDTPLANVAFDDLLGPRSDYLDETLNPPEGAFPVSEGGQFRTSCEFSHFAYDDPLVYPNQPGAAHLHMFWGNTDVNAYSSYESLRDSGSSTCNGQELNRTGYWAPAMFDGQGGVRIPERIIVYYKGYGAARDHAELYPDGAAIIAGNLHTVSIADGGVAGAPDQFAYNCANQYRGNKTPASNIIPTCHGLPDENPYTEKDPHRTLEMHVKFPNCWTGDDPADPTNWVLSTQGAGWFSSLCGSNTIVPNIEYIISYPIAEGESTEGWFLASDVDATTGTRSTVGNGGQSSHADWWGAWHPTAAEMWLDNCTTYVTDEPSGCGFGYLTDGGPDPANPFDGPALRYRPDYVGPISVPAATLSGELCPAAPAIAAPEHAASCSPPGTGGHDNSGTTTTTSTSTTSPSTTSTVPATTPATTIPGVTTTPGTTTTSVPSSEMSSFDEPASGHEPAQRLPN